MWVAHLWYSTQDSHSMLPFISLNTIGHLFNSQDIMVEVRIVMLLASLIHYQSAIWRLQSPFKFIDEENKLINSSGFIKQLLINITFLLWCRIMFCRNQQIDWTSKRCFVFELCLLINWKLTQAVSAVKK